MKQNQLEFDPDLELYDHLYNSEKLLFFEVNEGVYLAIDIADKNGRNKIHHMDTLVYDSLKGFIRSFLNTPKLISQIELH